MTESRVGVEWVEGNLFLGSDENGHTITFDSSLSAGPPKKSRTRGIGPMKALLACLGTCSGMDVVAILAKRKQKLESMTIEISGKRPDFGLPRPYTDIHMRFIISGEELQEKFVKEAVEDSATKFCSVAASLKARVTYSCKIVRA